MKAQDIKAGFTNQWYTAISDARLDTDGLKATVVCVDVQYKDGGRETRYFSYDTEVPGKTQGQA